MEIDNIATKYNKEVDKLEELNKDFIIQEMHITNYEKQKEIKQYLDYLRNPTVSFYLSLLEFQKEITNRINQLKKEHRDSISINLLITKAKSIKKAINRLKEENIIKEYLKILNNYKVKLYFEKTKELQKIQKQITLQEKRVDELSKNVRKKILIKKD